MTEREAVPEEFRDSPIANKITPPQRGYLESLLEQKDLSDQEPAKIDAIWKALRISHDPEEFGMSKQKASELITWLKGRRNLPNNANRQFHVTDTDFVPAGRYAVDSNEGELRFYHVWRPKNNLSVVRVYVLHGPDESRIPGRQAELVILQKIAAYGIREAAIRYGNEIGRCSNCGRRLTNRISRELGIGPICGGRMFDDGDWKAEVKAARQRIRDAGEDPNEEVIEDREAGPDECDRCLRKAELYHDEGTGLSLCDDCIAVLA